MKVNNFPSAAKHCKRRYVPSMTERADMTEWRLGVDVNSCCVVPDGRRYGRNNVETPDVGDSESKRVNASTNVIVQRNIFKKRVQFPWL